MSLTRAELESSAKSLSEPFCDCDDLSVRVEGTWVVHCSRCGWWSELKDGDVVIRALILKALQPPKGVRALVSKALRFIKHEKR